MTIREIDRQYKHWAIFPPVSLALARIGQVLGLSAPGAPAAEAFEPTSIDELRAVAASLGVASGG
jgi:hypothetical protein